MGVDRSVNAIKDVFTIFGARGTTPECGPHSTKYGGCTTCFTLGTEEGLLVIDAGSGITSLVRVMTEMAYRPDVSFLFTHYHMDHLIGLPNLPLIYDPEATVSFYGRPFRDLSLENVLSDLFRNPYWPVEFKSTLCNKNCVHLPTDKNEIEI